MASNVKITLVRSLNRTKPAQRKTAAALGLGRIGQTVEKVSNPAIEGMINTIVHLVKVERV